MPESKSNRGEFQLRTGSISMERLDGEVIAIDFSTGKYFSFQGPAADIIWMLEQGIPREQWLSLVSSSFLSDPERDTFDEHTNHFLTQLEQLDLLEAADSLHSQGAELPSDYIRGCWVQPEILINDDLVDLIVIDPIHDVGDDGWPTAKSSE